MGQNLSLIIPVFNAESTLRQCVDSILSQSFCDYELLLIDDGSKDLSSIICDEYAELDTRVKVYHKQNGGVSSARNMGLDHAEGEWVTFIDSDDIITKGYLDDVAEYDSDIVFKCYQKVKNEVVEGEVAYHELCPFNTLSSFVSAHLTKTVIRGPVVKFYKRKNIGALRFLSDMRIGEDAWFVFNYLAKCKTFAVSDQGLYVIRADERPDDVKYSITVDYAVQSLNYLKDAYNQLVQVHGIQKAKFLEYIGYFKRISKSDWISDKEKWYSNQQIKSLYDYVWSDLSAKQKLRLIIARLLKR